MWQKFRMMWQNSDDVAESILVVTTATATVATVVMAMDDFRVEGIDGVAMDGWQW